MMKLLSIHFAAKPGVGQVGQLRCALFLPFSNGCPAGRRNPNFADFY
jgi:hypothetical protein